MTTANYIENVADRNIGSIISSFAGQGVSPDFFYLTGYEGIFVEADRSQVCECVISSVVSLNSDLLLVVNSSSFDTWSELCDGLGINVTLVDAEHVSPSSIQAILDDNHDISHIMSLGVKDRGVLVALGALARANRRSFVVEVEGADNIRLADLDVMNIDYLVQTSDSAADMSLVIARRSKLVQTEGNARRPNQDIYAMWQSTVAVRSSSLKPMYL